MQILLPTNPPDRVSIWMLTTEKPFRSSAAKNLLETNSESSEGPSQRSANCSKFVEALPSLKGWKRGTVK
eukprot:Skav212262  [mRNA]  locus=scaffold732:40387:40596:+ [translate_table: standard]